MLCYGSEVCPLSKTVSLQYLIKTWIFRKSFPVIIMTLTLTIVNRIFNYCFIITNLLNCVMSVLPLNSDCIVLYCIIIWYTNCILTFGLGLSIPTLRQFCCWRFTVWYDMIRYDDRELFQQIFQTRSDDVMAECMDVFNCLLVVGVVWRCGSQ